MLINIVLDFTICFAIFW